MAKSIIHPVAAHERGVCAANPSASIGGRLARSDAIARLPIEIIMRERAHREQGFRASVGIIRPAVPVPSRNVTLQISLRSTASLGPFALSHCFARSVSRQRLCTVSQNLAE
jgi:hypothetical protein